MSLLGAIVVAAGRGTRLGAGERKQYLHIGDKPILVHTLEAFQRSGAIDEIVLVVGEGEEKRCEAWMKQYGLGKVREIVTGGSERQYSVYEGLRSVKSEWVLIHDGVRPFVTESLIERCRDAAFRYGASVAAVPVKDTIKITDSGGKVTSTPDRSRLWSVQTPQVFRRDQLLEAYEAAAREGFLGTDDASVAERYGINVHVATGDYDNIKITTPDDLEWARFRMNARR